MKKGTEEDGRGGRVLCSGGLGGNDEVEIFFSPLCGRKSANLSRHLGSAKSSPRAGIFGSLELVSPPGAGLLK